MAESCLLRKLKERVCTASTVEWIWGWRVSCSLAVLLCRLVQHHHGQLSVPASSQPFNLDLQRTSCRPRGFLPNTLPGLLWCRCRSTASWGHCQSQRVLCAPGDHKQELLSVRQKAQQGAQGGGHAEQHLHLQMPRAWTSIWMPSTSLRPATCAQPLCARTSEWEKVATLLQHWKGRLPSTQCSRQQWRKCLTHRSTFWQLCFRHICATAVKKEAPLFLQTPVRPAWRCYDNLWRRRMSCEQNARSTLKARSSALMIQGFFSQRSGRAPWRWPQQAPVQLFTDGLTCFLVPPAGSKNCSKLAPYLKEGRRMAAVFVFTESQMWKYAAGRSPLVTRRSLPSSHRGLQQMPLQTSMTSPCTSMTIPTTL
mmetsp:Transcript_44987/g.106854  ORF Transcript_44987/g.106854 Transcript_44987/m.106854 type:complete len:367 (+) Transcript_44987:608-1708(+)